jgi:hypothetical protein
MSSERKAASAEFNRRIRGKILTVVYENQERQGTRFDHVHLHAFFERLHFDLSENELITLLQDLRERGYLIFDEVKDRRTHEVSIFRIQITPGGRDIVEEIEADKAVSIE